MREGKCVICGKSFIYNRGKKTTCSDECARERNRITSREYKREMTAKRKEPKKVKSDLNNDLQAARKLGMSYGNYIAYVKGG